MPWTLTLLVACTGATETPYTWVVDEADLGAPTAAGTGFAFDTPQAAWLAAEHVVPDLRWSWPPSNVPLFLWNEVLMGENVSDDGTCPYVTASGSAQTWRSDCRSQDGYDWVGTYTIDETEDGLWTLLDYTFGLQVASEVDGRAFDKVDLAGRMFYVDGDDTPLVRSSQSNMHLEVAGYWSRGFEDALEIAWDGLAITGRWEGQVVDGVEQITIDADLDLGDHGGFHASGTVTSDGCLIEPTGTITLVGVQTAVLEFDGSDSCDGCATLTVDGVRHANACRGR